MKCNERKVTKAVTYGKRLPDLSPNNPTILIRKNNSTLHADEYFLFSIKIMYQLFLSALLTVDAVEAVDGRPGVHHVVEVRLQAAGGQQLTRQTRYVDADDRERVAANRRLVERLNTLVSISRSFIRTSFLVTHRTSVHTIVCFSVRGNLIQ